MCVVLTVCSTCRLAGSAAAAPDGERLALELEAAARDRSNAPRIVRHSCLWACGDACTVLIESRSRTGYLAGGFAPGEDSARALLDWSEVYGGTTDGQVAYELWPEGMKGHFIARLPFRSQEGEQ
jgi:predicted metal-binding protein